MRGTPPVAPVVICHACGNVAAMRTLWFECETCVRVTIDGATWYDYGWKTYEVEEEG